MTIDRDIQKEIMQWFWFTPDRIMNRMPEADWDRWEPVLDALESAQEAIGNAVCSVVGHEPERDQCNLPEHDYCQWCRMRMPHGACDRWPCREHGGPALRNVAAT